MFFDKMKKFLDEKKTVCVIGGLILFGIFLYFQVRDDNTIENATKIKTNSDNKQHSSHSSKFITCDISGAINKSGVYTLKSGSRLNDLIKKAGGLRSDAQLRAINRARILKDQDQIYIPDKTEKVADTAAETNNVKSDDKQDKININTATVQELQKLSGIGQKRAEQIIECRERIGGF
ncbi:MAG: helix-hairpin-helix domain-containing protein, partial [Lactobacillus iners]|nr:helix-hairpin-helix domain-containing protein [Lactobacillus iners]